MTEREQIEQMQFFALVSADEAGEIGLKRYLDPRFGINPIISQDRSKGDKFVRVMAPIANAECHDVYYVRLAVVEIIQVEEYHPGPTIHIEHAAGDETSKDAG